MSRRRIVVWTVVVLGTVLAVGIVVSLILIHTGGGVDIVTTTP